MDDWQPLLATVATQHDLPDRPKEVDDRYGIKIMEEPAKAKRRTGGDGDHELASPDEYEARSHAQTSDPDAEIPRRFVEVDYPEQTQRERESGLQLEEDPLWRCVQSELERKNGKFYRYVFHDRKSTDPYSIDPVRRAASMGLKIILLSYLPLTRFACLFLWCLFLLVSMSYFVIFQYVTRFNYRCVHNTTDYNTTFLDCTKIHDEACVQSKIIQDIVVAVAFILTLADFLVLMIYSFNKRRITAQGQERAFSSRPSVVRSRLGAFLYYWRKYGEIPRLILQEALLYTLFANISLCYEPRSVFFIIGFVIVFPTA